MMIALSLMISINFSLMNHPLAMGLIILIQTVMISMISGMMSQSFWFSYILFLIFLGGMLVLFIYVASLASNEMFSLDVKSMLISIFSVIVMYCIIKTLSFTNLQNQETNTFMILSNQSTLSLISLYNMPTNVITIMLALYLLLTLIVVVNITNIFEGPLRQMN
uniref:NADH-ubiquinone oxidoreductase chain 6 n=1 Tax=Byrsotria cabrerai TaxID=2093431 RepID=A0A2P1H738_9NEOP|nr:NADH dehydrogenase subunit 6 [Byrsotria cabrerai]